MDYVKTLRGFLDGEGKLRQFPSKMKAKVPAMFYIAEKLEHGKQYSDKEIKEIINSLCAFNDPATVRRDMIDNKFLERTSDGRTYWLVEELPKFPELEIE